jgi:murein DD-endopeptidase MepM/ murein hydrolase activator NlpD
MTHHFRRTALVLLAGTALGLGAAPALAQPAAGPQEQAVAAPGVDAFYRTRHHHKASGPAATYKVRKGDTLAEVADRLGTSVEALAKTNRLRSPYRLSPGQTLKNPNARQAAAEPKASGRKGARAESETYVVKSGDTLFSISKRFGVSVAELKAANGLGRSNSIPRGRRLSIPGAGGAEAADETPPPRVGRRYEPVSEEIGAPGRVITIETAGKAYRVRKGDSLEKAARKMGVDADDLIRVNHLKRPYHLRKGQTLRGPGGTAKAYVVARGDTLASVAGRFDVSVDKLRTTNGLRRGAALAPGRKLRLPAGYRDTGPVERPEPPPRSSFSYPTPPGQTLPPPRSAQPELPPTPQPYAPPRNTPRPYTPPPGGPISGAPTASPQVSDAQIMQMGRGLFQWPLKGRLLSGFGDKGTSQRNDGMNIAANAGEPVRAAASGDVVYAGDQVPGFGNLVLIKHADGWVTAYGHLGKVNVRMQQKVAQGEQIGEAGSTGGVSEPQLHFEVRFAPTPQERARPVDPALVLPK